ncbi:MAG: glycosyltransferase family 4 protein [Desulfuromonadales bacterium]|nr:glycosyltransferase family 4 protein [Desulfuromonadales bacterium]
MRVLIVVPSQDRISGNWITAGRFKHGLEDQGHQVALYATSLQPQGGLRQQLHDFNPDIALLLHAYRSGKPWLEEAAGLDIPCVAQLTGTDVNQGLNDPEQSDIIRILSQQAEFVILQNPLIAAELSASHPELTMNLRLVKPGIILGSAPYDLHKIHDLAKEKTLFLCPAGLRPIKGVMELLEMFDRVAAESSTCQLAFCGPILDENYGSRFLAAIEKRPWSSYLGTIPVEAMANAMRGTDVILNNSQAEGLANTLLEAAALGVPILARNIPGNATVVRHNINGLLYDNETEFVQYALQLCKREKRQRLSCPDPDRYNPVHETAELITILLEATNAGRRELCSSLYLHP